MEFGDDLENVSSTSRQEEADQQIRGARPKRQTEKGVAYARDNQRKQLNRLFRQVKSITESIQTKINGHCDVTEVRDHYKEWMTVCETLLEQNIQYCELLSKEEMVDYLEETWDGRDTFLQNFKAYFLNWESTQQSQNSSEVGNSQCKSALSVRSARKGALSVRSAKSSSSTVSSARLKAEQDKAALLARIKALKRKQQIEEAKLKLNNAEEELKLTTELDVVEAKERVLDEFEEKESSCHVALNVDVPTFSPAKQQTVTHSSSSSNSSEEVMLSVVKQLKKPTPELKKFSGEPTQYRRFLRQFNSKVAIYTDSDDERMSFLEQYTVGEANKIVSGYSHLPASHGYTAALKELESRYGDVDRMAQAFIKKALDWPEIRADDPKALDDFGILLAECENAVTYIESVKVLEYPDNMRKLVGKLPFFLHDKWRNIVQKSSEKGGVKFQELVKFVKYEAKKAIDPLYGKEALRSETKKGQEKRDNKNSTRIKSSFATDVSSIARVCTYCKANTHCTDRCKQLSNLPVTERLAFVRTKGICYGCLKQGHLSRDCRSRSVCDVCKLRHPTSLHDPNRLKREQIKDKKPEECSNFAKGVHTRAGNEGQCTMAVVPVNIQLNNGLQVLQTYAFLDLGSSVSFISDSLTRKLGARGQKRAITLETMGLPFSMTTSAIQGLQIAGLDVANTIDLPTVYTKDKIPISQHHIPTTEDLTRWEHFKDINLPHIDGEIGLLLGNNIPDAYTPFELRTGKSGSPHAARTKLGWIVWNLIRGDNQGKRDSESFTVNRVEIAAIQEIEDLKSLDTLVRNTINLDFPERLSDDKREHSQQDKQFMELVNESITHKNGHYSIGLPFKDSDVKLPDNKEMALKRLNSLRRKLQSNVKFAQDYNNFVSKILENGYAERVPQKDLQRDDGRVWHIPHHAVYHPRKPEKIRVVFDCAATYRGISLNQVLLQGPDLNNSLVGVLLRFREEEIAIMGDIESMFSQIRIPKEDCDCLRFLWWPGGNISQKPAEYRMLVHPFGAVSSPSCASFALKRTADDKGHDTVAAKVVNNSFYVDDCLVSAPTVEEASHLVQSTTSLCKEGGFRLTKWVSNNYEVLQSIPVEERAKNVQELQLERQEIPSERALGVYWLVKEDKLGFKINVQRRPATRRGILSIASSVYDPIGIAAPFVLRAKMLLQSLCRRNVGWDEEIVGEEQRVWNQWLDEVAELDNIKIDRCYKPLGFGEVDSCQLIFLLMRVRWGMVLPHTYVLLIKVDILAVH